MLRRYSIIDTCEVDSMYAVLSQTYGARSLRVPGGNDGFRAKAQHVQFGNAGVSYCYYGAHTEVDFPGIEDVRLQISLNGSGETVFGKTSLGVSDETSCIIPPGADITTKFGIDFTQVVLRIDRSALEQKLAALLGIRPGKGIEFETAVEWSDGHMARLRRLVLFFVGEIAREPDLSSLFLGQFEQNLVTAFLCSTRHNFRHLLDQPSPDIAPWQVRRAEAYIEANWDRPLTIEELSTQIETSARSIFETFKNTRGYSPMAFLKSVRLRHARTMLEKPNANTTVSGVSLSCGFQNLGHFARDYREVYGELPSATLTRARGGGGS